MKEETYDHGLSNSEVAERLRALAAYWNWRYRVRTVWTGNVAKISGRVLGIRFRGRVIIEPGKLRGQLDAGFLGERLGGRRYLLRKLDDYLNPDHSVEALWARVRPRDHLRQPA